MSFLDLGLGGVRSARLAEGIVIVGASISCTRRKRNFAFVNNSFPKLDTESLLSYRHEPNVFDEECLFQRPN